MELLKCQTTLRDDMRDHPDFQEFRPPTVGHESSLQQFTGTPVFHWYHRTLKSVYWLPYGQPMIAVNADGDILTL